MSYEFGRKFDVIYSSLTFMHIKDKQAAINKVKTLLNFSGRFVLSIDKSQSDTIEYGTRKIKIHPDRKEDIAEYINQSGMSLIKVFETEFDFCCGKAELKKIYLIILPIITGKSNV